MSTLSPAPCAEPPYDPVARPRAYDPGAGVQGTLALTFTLPSGAAADPVRALHAVPPDDPHRWGEVFARVFVEVLAGERPVTQLLGWTTPEVYAALGRRARTRAATQDPTRTARPRSVTGRAHVCRPAPDVAEVASVVHGRERAWALAFRLERRRGNWLCTEILLG